VPVVIGECSDLFNQFVGQFSGGLRVLILNINAQLKTDDANRSGNK